MREKFRKLVYFIKKHIYILSYLGILSILTKYILQNWEKYISMQFFSKFDGNNILFLVWIASILDILSEYINPTEIFSIKMRIANIAAQDNAACAMRVLDIEKELLKLARNILSYYP